MFRTAATLAAMAITASVSTALPLAAQESRPTAASEESVACLEENLGLLQDLHRRGQYVRVVEACSGEEADGLPPELEMLLLCSLARGGRGFEALPRAEALLRSRPNDAGVRATAATVYLAVGRMEDAAREADAALSLNPSEPEGWLARAALALMHHDGSGALDALREAESAEPRLHSALITHIPAVRAARAVRDPDVLARVMDARARHLEERAASGDDAREEATMLREGARGTLFSVTSHDDLVILPFTPCWEESPYRCVGLEADGKEYRVLLDTGNQPGWTVHAPQLLEALPHHLGSPSSITTGSVDTALVSRRLVTERMELGEAVISALPGHFFPKPREPWFDANLNPFFIQDRVITLDYVQGRTLLRTKERFDRDMAAVDPSAVTAVPLYGTDWGFVPILVNGVSGWCMIETGAEVFSLSRGFAERSGIPLTEATMVFREREYQYHTAQVEVEVGGLPFLSDSAAVWPARILEPSLGMFYDAIMGPGSLEGRFVLSYDPFDRKVVLERVRQRARRPDGGP
jgi:hypothetical protein